MDKSRQQFEEWVADNAYLFMHINLMYHEAALYKLWQASREGLEIVLPKPRRVEHQNYVDHEAAGFNLAIGICQDVLKNIGVKVHE